VIGYASSAYLSHLACRSDWICITGKPQPLSPVFSHDCKLARSCCFLFADNTLFRQPGRQRSHHRFRRLETALGSPFQSNYFEGAHEQHRRHLEYENRKMEESSIISESARQGRPSTSRPASPHYASSRNQHSPIRKRRKVNAISKTELGRKRQKIMGRPKNSWTPRRLRRLVRLYLMTDLEVTEIAKVLQSTEFQPWLVQHCEEWYF
jgi:hypothetical protein